MKSKNIVSVLIASVVVGFSPVNAITVNFSQEEGYKDGLLNHNPNWKSKQWLIDSASGTATDDGYDDAIYVSQSQKYRAGYRYTVSATFSFEEASMAPNKEKWKALFNVGFINTTALDSAEKMNSIRLSLDRYNKQYIVDIQSDYGSAEGDNVKGSGGHSQSAPFSSESIGISRDTADMTSDQIRLVMIITAGETMNEWNCDSTIYNTDTGKIVTSFSTTGLTFDAEKIYGVMGIGHSKSNAVVGERRVHSFSFSADGLSTNQSYAWLWKGWLFSSLFY